MARGSNANRRTSTQGALERKVEALRLFVLEGPPTAYVLPTSLRTLRSWSDAARGLVIIGSPSSTDARLAPHNMALVAEARGLMTKLQRQTKKPRPKSPTLRAQLDTARTKTAVKEMLVERLTSQLTEALHLADVAVRDSRTEVERRKRLEDLNQELRKTLSKCTCRNRPRLA